ncbi:hypothetical protein [Microbacterium sp. NPDC055665]
MTTVVVEVIVSVVAMRTRVRTAVPAVRASVTATALGGAATAWTPITGTTPAQAGQRLRDGFGGILRGGVVRFGGHGSILHAT